MRQYIYLAAFIIPLFILSCNTYDPTPILTGGSHKFWYKMSSPNFSYKFDKDGSCYYYISQETNDGKIERKQYGFGDLVYPNTWRIVNETTIEIQGFSYYYELLGDCILKLKDVDNPAKE